MATEPQTDNDLFQEVAGKAVILDTLLEKGQIDQFKSEYEKVREKNGFTACFSS